MKHKNILGVGVALICIGGLLLVCPFSLAASQKGDVSKAKAVMQTLKDRDISEIEEAIGTVQDSFKPKKQDLNSFSARFSHTIIIGDSMAESLLEYNLLPSSIVIAKRGKRTDNVEEEINNVINIAPKAVFIQYGLNDLEYCRGKADRFVSQYKQLIEKIKKALPNTKIYINSITPINQEAQRKTKAYIHVDDFNVALITMCEELHLVYIDNTNLVDFNGDVYEKDGIHPTYPYYPLWLENMLDYAGL